MSDFFRLVQQRESCRNYQPGRYPTREQLVHCVEAARLAPSACNSQPWSFIVANHEAMVLSAGRPSVSNSCCWLKEPMMQVDSPCSVAA